MIRILLISITIFISGLGLLKMFSVQVKNQSNPHQIVQEAIDSKNYTKAIEKAVNLFNLNKQNCREVILSSQVLSRQDENIVAQTNFDQIVRINPKGDVFISSERLVSTLFHEFLHCDHNQLIYSFLVKNNSNLILLKQKYPRLADFAIESEKNNNQNNKIEKNLLTLLTPLSTYLKNFYEIDAIFKVLQSHSLFVNNSLKSPEKKFNLNYLKKSFTQEAIKKKLVLNDYLGVCKSIKDDLEDEIAKEFWTSCMEASKLLIGPN